jgi:hypothetical protein
MPLTNDNNQYIYYYSMNILERFESIELGILFELGPIFSYCIPDHKFAAFLLN